MLNTSDPETLLNLRLLVDTASREHARVVVWVGAGASAWCGYPLWSALAHSFHTDFASYELNYDRPLAAAHLESRRFPELFQLCKKASVERFNQLLVRAMAPRQATPVYERFIAALDAIGNVSVLTTNVDELLEKHLPLATTVGWSDIDCVRLLLDERRRFVCKVHGSISQIESVVFTSEQYVERAADGRYIAMLERVFAQSTVVFVGYSFQDRHVISCLQRNADIAPLFGSGPHFAITPLGETDPLPGVRYIRFSPEPHTDHRACLTVLEEIAFGKPVAAVPTIRSPLQANNGLKSGHILSDIWPPGSWQTSQTMTITRLPQGERVGMVDQDAHELVVGNGYTEAEFGRRASTAMHDLIVGLLCFDEVYAPMQSLGRLYALLGEEWLLTLVREGAIQIINWPQQEAVAFTRVGKPVGGIASVVLHNDDLSRKSVREILRRHLPPLEGSEARAEQLYAEIEPRIRTISGDKEGNIPGLVRGLLLRPSVRRVLGISDGMPVNTIPRWHAFSVLRLAHVVKIGAACRALQLGSAKLEFGAAVLAGPAFAAARGNEWTDDVASYVVAGRFAADLGGIAAYSPEILASVMKFRHTSSGVDLRKQVLASLAIGHGGEVAVAVDGGLAKAIPPKFLQHARDAFVGLLTSAPVSGNAQPAIWNDRRYAEDDLVRWRDRSRALLEGLCRENKIGGNDKCPCGSGEKLKACCALAL